MPLGLHTYTVVGLTQGADIARTGNRWCICLCLTPRRSLYQRDNEEVRNQRQRLLRTLSLQSYVSPAEAEKLQIRLQPDTHIINAILVKVAPGRTVPQSPDRLRPGSIFPLTRPQKKLN